MFIETQEKIKINVITHGDENNPAIVLLHGIGADHQMFSPQIEKYANSGYYIIAPDMRGHGESSKIEQLELSNLAYDVKEILNHLKVNKAIVIGVSMGGVIAQQFVADYPDKVKMIRYATVVNT